MAKRVHALAQSIGDTYGGNAARVWTEARDGKDLERRIAALPGFGEMKVKSLIAVLGKRLGVAPKGWEDVAPDYPTLGDVDSLDALAQYQGWKRTSKAAAKESGKPSNHGRTRSRRQSTPPGSLPTSKRRVARPFQPLAYTQAHAL